jgi:c-di-GMP-binding flagellar brake protein YcgR
VLKLHRGAQHGPERGGTLAARTQRGLVAAERRAAPRIHASPFAMVTPLDGSVRTPQAAQLIELSVVGCAIRYDGPLEIGTHVVLASDGLHGSVRLTGEIVRIWQAEPSTWMYAGIQFDPMPAAEQRALQSFLAKCIRAYDQARRGAANERR